MPGVVYLGGGGTGVDESHLWGEMLAGCRRLLYWPFALTGDMLDGAETWLRGQLHRLGFSVDITTWTTLHGRQPADLDHADLLFVGGGNTFALLQQVRDHGFEEPVRQWVAAGGDYYGGSAGAVLATDSIAIAAHADPDHVGLIDHTGLGLVPGVGVLPHFTPDQEPAARSFSYAYAVPILGIPEAAGLISHDGIIRTVGPDPVWTIDGDVTIQHRPGSALPLSGNG